MCSAPHQNRILDRLAAGVCLTLDELDQDLPELPRQKIIKAISRMKSHGLVEKQHDISCYQITMKGIEKANSGQPIKSGPKGKRTGVSIHKETFRCKAWRIARRRGLFTIPSILSSLEQGDLKNPQSNLERYFRTLIKAGYLRRTGRRHPGTKPTSNGFVEYEVTRNNGPKAPVVLSDGTGIYDPNLGIRIPFAEVTP